MNKRETDELITCKNFFSPKVWNEYMYKNMLSKFWNEYIYKNISTKQIYPN